MQRYVQNQSKKVAKNKIVMETNANKTTLFLQLMRKRCFLSVLNLLTPPTARAPPHNINYQGSSRFAGPSS